MGGLLGGPKGMLAPLSNYWGGGAGPPPPLPTPMEKEGKNETDKVAFLKAYPFNHDCEDSQSK